MGVLYRTSQLLRECTLTLEVDRRLHERFTPEVCTGLRVLAVKCTTALSEEVFPVAV